jgi:hypothetical protein
MTKHQKEQYQPEEKLQQIIKSLTGQKFKLACGHHITFGYFLGNDITIQNGKNPTIICRECGY